MRTSIRSVAPYCLTSLLFASLPNPIMPAQNMPASDASVSAFRQAVAGDKALILAQPMNPANYVDLAYTLSDAGMGEAAREQARKATEVAPASSFAYSALGWILHHNEIGVDYGHGYDYEGSMAAYQRAIVLAPLDLDIRQSFADSLEFNPDGIRYAPDAHLAEAVRALRYIKARQAPVSPSVEDNLLIDLFYEGHFSEVLAEMVASPTPVRDGIALASVAASQGAAAAIKAANQIADNPQRRSAALNFAAEGLWNMRLYPQAADLLTAGLEDHEDSSATLRKIQLFRTLKPFQADSLASSDPGSPVQKLLISELSAHFAEADITANVARYSFADEAEWQAFLAKTRQANGGLHALSVKTGLPYTVMQDILLGSMKLITEPAGGAGFRVVLQTMISSARHFFVLQDGGAFKVVAEEGDALAVGNAALYLLHHARESEAYSLLAWGRDHVQSGSGDDPLGGNLFARVWVNGKSEGPGAIELGAAALLAAHGSVASLLPRLHQLQEQAASEQSKTVIDLILCTAYISAGDGSSANPIAQRLLKQYPDSPTAVRLSGSVYGLLKDWAAWNTMLDRQLTKRPDDYVLLEQKAVEAEEEGNYPGAMQRLRLVLDRGKGISADYNTYAWLALVSGHVDAQATEAAEHANILDKGSDYASLYTLACIYATQGKVTEARQLLLQAMSARNLAEPDSEIWFGFGLLYEQYGAAEAAIAAYSRVEKPAGRVNPLSAYALAQQRLKSLKALSGHTP